jgi:hypothetical protein
MAMRPLEEIIRDLCHEHTDALYGEAPRTHRDSETGDDITEYRGKTYRNLTGQQVWSLKDCYVAGVYHRLCEALDYQNKLYMGLHPLHADDLLREMRKKIKYN